MPEELSQDDIDALLSGAGDGGNPAASSGATDLGELLGNAEQWDLPEAGGIPDNASAEPSSINMLYDVELDVKIELGRTHMTVEDVLRMREGSVIQLDKDAGAPVDILINNRLVAEGEVLVLNDYFCVRVTNILSDRDRSIIKR